MLWAYLKPWRNKYQTTKGDPDSTSTGLAPSSDRCYHKTYHLTHFTSTYQLNLVNDCATNLNVLIMHYKGI